MKRVKHQLNKKLPRSKISKSLTIFGLTIVLILSCTFIPSTANDNLEVNQNNHLPNTKQFENQIDENNLENSREVNNILQDREEIKYIRNEEIVTRNSHRFTKSRGAFSRKDREWERYFQIIAPTVKPSATISSHPSFTVYFDRPSNYQTFVSLEINQGNTNEIFWEKEIKVEQAGFRTITFPASEEELKPGRDYRFSVEMVVDPEYRAYDIVAQVWFEKVNLPAELTTKMDNSSDLERAIILAKNGIWYDTLTLLQQENRTKLIKDVLSQVGLLDIAEKID